ncbi:hypothetical protein [Lactococcus lactis]|uniref:hypothetical protein n=1 Tax=Lactococcus lactis TaxID=1358 RepID=UPI0037C9ED1C
MREDNYIVTKVYTASIVARGGVGTIVGDVTAKSKSSSNLKEISIRFKLSDMNNPYQEILVAFSISKDEISKEKQQEVYKLFSQLELLLYNIKNE